MSRNGIAREYVFRKLSPSRRGSTGEDTVTMNIAHRTDSRAFWLSQQDRSASVPRAVSLTSLNETD